MFPWHLSQRRWHLLFHLPKRIRERGGGWQAALSNPGVTVDSTHLNKQCIEHFQDIFEKEDAEAAAAAVARSKVEISATHGKEASASSGAALQCCLVQQLNNDCRYPCRK